MKKNYAFIIVLLLTAINFFAQPVLNLGNFPTSSSAFVTEAFPGEGFTGVMNSGPDQVWDFSSFQISLCCANKIMNLVPLNSTPYASYFPTANYCYKIDTDGAFSYQFHKVTPTTFELLGGAAGFGPNIFNPAFKDFQFPYEYSDVVNTEYSTVPVISTYDAYGSLIAPMGMGTFTDVIRKKTIYTGDATEYYTWYNTNPFHIIMEATVLIDTTTYTLYMTTASGSMSVDQNIKETALTVSPNPANAILNLKLSNNTSIDKVIITDINGKVVIEKTENLTSIDVQNLAKGIYILSAYSGKNQLQTKFIKE